nr:hypothetical protein [Pseudonocardia sp. MH-G8]
MHGPEHAIDGGELLTERRDPGRDRREQLRRMSPIAYTSDDLDVVLELSGCQDRDAVLDGQRVDGDQAHIEVLVRCAFRGAVGDGACERPVALHDEHPVDAACHRLVGGTAVVPEQLSGLARQWPDRPGQPARVRSEQQVDVAAVQPLRIGADRGRSGTAVVDQGQSDAGGLGPQPYGLGCVGPLPGERAGETEGQGRAGRHGVSSTFVARRSSMAR